MCLSHSWRKDLLIQRYLEVRLEEKGCGAARRLGRMDATGGSWCFHVELFVGLRKSIQLLKTKPNTKMATWKGKFLFRTLDCSRSDFARVYLYQVVLVNTPRQTLCCKHIAFARKLVKVADQIRVHSWVT